jgi:hypothetical protein
MGSLQDVADAVFAGAKNGDWCRHKHQPNEKTGVEHLQHNLKNHPLTRDKFLLLGD